MKINIFQRAGGDTGTVIKMLRTINSGDEIIIEYSRHSGLRFSPENILGGVYLLITIALLSVFFIALYKISRLKKIYPETSYEGINFITTDAKGTPFSFFNSIFWNSAIDIYSRQGQQIFNHEIAHVKEKHSYDKIFMKVVLIFFWANPFFWLIQKELGMIHEFIADKEALEDSDISSFAEMILQTVYPGKQFSIANNFFHSPLKRRLIMFTKNKNPKVSYISRLLVLPLAAIVFMAFTLKMKTLNTLTKYEGKKITVIIDAGHGGDDNGAVENNVKEKDLNLSIAKEVKLLNKNENINIILSRDGDDAKSPKDRVKFADEKKADLFISIHVDGEENKNTHNGVIIFIPKNDNSYLKESKLLGSALIESFKNNYQLNVAEDLKQREQGIWVLKANQCPSVLLETGFLSSQADLEYLTNPANHKIIAQNILNGIEKYAEENVSDNNSVSSESKIFARLEGNAMFYDSINKVTGEADTIIINSIDPLSDLNIRGEAKSSIDIRKYNTPKDPVYFVDGKEITKEEMKLISPNSIKSINVLTGENAVGVYGEKAKNGVVQIIKKDIKTTAVKPFDSDEVASVPAMVTFKKSVGTTQNPIYLVDGKETDVSEMKNIPPGNIESINVIKGEAASKKYGEKGKSGVIEITLKQERTRSDTIPQMLFTKVENEAEFPGGYQAWLKYIVSKIQQEQDSIQNEDFGTCLVKFIVNTDGSINNVEATTMKNSQLARIAVDAIRNGPKWKPATQNNQVVASYRLQPVTLSEPK